MVGKDNGDFPEIISSIGAFGGSSGLYVLFSPEKYLLDFILFGISSLLPSKSGIRVGSIAGIFMGPTFAMTKDLKPIDTYLPAGFLDAAILTLGGTALVPGIHDRLDDILDGAGESTFKLVNTVFDFRNEKLFPGQPWPIGRDHRSFSSIDLLIMDREEAMKISGENSLDKALGYFSCSPLKAFMVTDGSQPVSIYSRMVKPGTSGDHRLSRLPVSSALLSQSLKGELNADTTGAGDNFVGGVIFSLAQQMARGIETPDLVEAAKWGIVSGGFACTYMGGTFLEEYPGHKLKVISEYYELYAGQLKNG